MKEQIWLTKYIIFEAVKLTLHGHYAFAYIYICVYNLNNGINKEKKKYVKPGIPNWSLM